LGVDIGQRYANALAAFSVIAFVACHQFDLGVPKAITRDQVPAM
jgi:hypothetical protein